MGMGKIFGEKATEKSKSNIISNYFITIIKKQENDNIYG